MISLAIGPIQLIFIVPGILAFCSLIYVLFYNTDKIDFDIPLLPQVFLYFLALVPLGIIVGLFIRFRKKKSNNTVKFKFSEKSRSNALLILAISSIATILALTSIT